MTSLEEILLALFIVGFIIYRQVKARKVNAKTLIIFPFILLFFGVKELSSIHFSGIIWVLFAISAAFSILTGVWRGSSVKVWQHQDGTHMYKGTKFTFAIWAVTFLGRIVLEAITHMNHAEATASTSEILLFIGLTITSQNLVIALRTIWKGN